MSFSAAGLVFPLFPLILLPVSVQTVIEDPVFAFGSYESIGSLVDEVGHPLKAIWKRESSIRKKPETHATNLLSISTDPKMIPNHCIDM